MTLYEYRKIHKWLRDTYGNAHKCESKDCGKKSQNYDWALLKGKKYEYQRRNFIQLCRSCHSKYDITDEFRKKISEIHKGVPRPDVSKNMKGNQYGRKYQKIKCKQCNSLFQQKNKTNKFCNRDCYNLSISKTWKLAQQNHKKDVNSLV